MQMYIISTKQYDPVSILYGTHRILEYINEVKEKNKNISIVNENCTAQNIFVLISIISDTNSHMNYTSIILVIMLYYILCFMKWRRFIEKYDT